MVTSSAGRNHHLAGLEALCMTLGQPAQTVNRPGREAICAALEGIRTPNLLIRSYSARCAVHAREGAGRWRATGVQLDGVANRPASRFPFGAVPPLSPVLNPYGSSERQRRPPTCHKVQLTSTSTPPAASVGVARRAGYRRGTGRDRDRSRGNCQSRNGHEGSNRSIITIRPSGSR